jgi:hypothetical protein
MPDNKKSQTYYAYCFDKRASILTNLKTIVALTICLAGLMLAGAEGPDLGAQIAVNLAGMVMFVTPILVHLHREKRR